MAKKRIDQILVDRQLAPSRNRAQAMILAGEVIVEPHRVDKPGTRVDEDAEIRLKQRGNQFVSRAGAKLAGALDHFGLQVSGQTALDAGASTGGFVGVLLQRGVRRVYAVDVGYGQLDYKLQQDPRVVVRDRVNLRHLTAEQVPELVDLVTLDLSFISLTKVLQALLPFMAERAHLVCLVKPQFEVGRQAVGKGGIVRDAQARQQAVDNVRQCAEGLGLQSLGQITSPIKGQKGNIEFLLALQRTAGKITNHEP